MVGAGEDAAAVDRGKLLPPPDAHVQIEVLELVLDGRPVEPRLPCGRNPMTSERFEDLSVLRVETG